MIRVGLAAIELVLGQFAVAHRIAAGQLGGGGIIGNRLHFKDMQAAEGGNLFKGQRRIVDQPGGRRMRHQRMGGSGHGFAPSKMSSGNGNSRPFSERLCRQTVVRAPLRRKPRHRQAIGHARRG
jgi:hypothetical protein